MAKTVEFHVTQDPTVEEIKRRLEERRREIANTSTPMRKASIYLDAWVQRNFKSEGGKVGGWKKLKAGGRWKSQGGGKPRKFDPSAKILQDTGRLRASFLPFATRNNAGIGSDIDYAPAHEYGMKLPMRRMLPKRKEVIDDIKKILNKHVEVKTEKKL